MHRTFFHFGVVEKYCASYTGEEDFIQDCSSKRQDYHNKGKRSNSSLLKQNTGEFLRAGMSYKNY